MRPFEEWKDSVRNYFLHNEFAYGYRWWESDPLLLEAITEEITTLKKLIPNKLMPLSILEGYKVSRKGTNLGLPYVTSTWDEKVVGHYLRRASDLIDGKSPKLYPFVLFRRVQPGGPERSMSKQRPVWGADHAESFAGICTETSPERVVQTY